MAASTPAVASTSSESNRWVILLFSILGMVAVANFQYGWTLFVPPLQKKLNVDQALIQVTFTVAQMPNMIASAGYQAAFIRWGIIQGLTVIVAAFFLKSPPAGWMPKTWRIKGSPEVKKRQTQVDFTSGEMVATPNFWLMYLMMAMVATGGLMAVAPLKPMALHFKFDQITFHFLRLQ